MEEHKGEYCFLHFRVKCQTKPGQFLAVSGYLNTFEDSDFNVLRLVTGPSSYPTWSTSKPVFVPRGEIIQYKYCIMEGRSVHHQETSPRYITPDEENVVIQEEIDINSFHVNHHQNEGPNILEQTTELKRNRSETDAAEWKQIAERNNRLFLVCYHLPVVIRRTNRPEHPFEVSWAESLIAKTEGSISESLKTIWIGTISVSKTEITASEKEFLVNLLREIDCIPVFLDDAIADAAYNGFCKKVMWPVFHNVDQLDHIHAAWNLPEELLSPAHSAQINSSSADPTSTLNYNDLRDEEHSTNVVLEWSKREQEYLSAFIAVNEIFHETIALHAAARDGDVVWVHDYHLMLLPQLLRDQVDGKRKGQEQQQKIDLKIIFFLHIPFPTSQLFRTMPEANTLLQSMLSADLVGFHAFDHARHFLNAARRNLGI